MNRVLVGTMLERSDFAAPGDEKPSNDICLSADRTGAVTVAQDIDIDDDGIEIDNDRVKRHGGWSGGHGGYGDHMGGGWHGGHGGGWSQGGGHGGWHLRAKRTSWAPYPSGWHVDYGHGAGWHQPYYGPNQFGG